MTTGMGGVGLLYDHNHGNKCNRPRVLTRDNDGGDNNDIPEIASSRAL
jgi:hypothetical protein